MSRTTFRIVVEQEDLRLDVFLTEDGSLAFHMTNEEGTLDTVIEADAYLFERGLEALIDTLDDAQEGCCDHDHHHHHHGDCCCDDDDCDDCDEDWDDEDEDEDDEDEE